MPKKNKEQLEYNDGIGDMLRDKDIQPEKNSTLKLIILFILAFLIVVMFIFLSFKIIKKIVLTNYELQKLEQKYNQEEKTITANIIVTGNKENTSLVCSSNSSAKQLAQTVCTKNITMKAIVCSANIKMKESVKIENTHNKNKEAVKKTRPQKKSNMISNHIYKRKVVEKNYKETKKIKIESQSFKDQQPKKLAPSSLNSQSKKNSYKIIAGSFDSYALAKTKVTELKAKGFDSFVLRRSDNGKETFYVQLGALSSYRKASRAVKEFQKAGINVTIINVPK